MPEDPTKTPNGTLDLSQIRLADIGSRLAEKNQTSDIWLLENPEGMDFLGCRLKSSANLIVRGPLGDYCFVGMEDAEVDIDGDIDACCGQAIQSGNIVIQGNAGACLGSFGRGGWIAVHGTAGARCGAGLNGAEIITFGNVGQQAGFGMQSGTLVIGGAAGNHLGMHMKGGTIYVRGQVESVAPGIHEFRIKETDRFKLGLLLLKAGLKGAATEFRGYRKEEE